MNSRVFFLIGCGRSGTTALARALATATNALVTIEAEPKLCIASRAQWEGTLHRPGEYIVRSTRGRIEAALREHRVCGDKNPNYLHFVPELHQHYGSRFVFIVRNGRDVVRSCMDFDRHRTPCYERYEDAAGGSVVQPEDDFWDYARLRPRRGEPLAKDWRDLPKFEKFCWYWARFNEILLQQRERVPAEAARLFDMTNADTAKVGELFEFLGLEGFEPDRVDGILRQGVNRTATPDSPPFPAWADWSPDARATFERHAGATMRRLGAERWT